MHAKSNSRVFFYRSTSLGFVPQIFRDYFHSAALLTHTHENRQDPYGILISPTQNSLPENSQHSKLTDKYATGGNLIRNPTKAEDAMLLLRLHDHWDRQTHGSTFKKY